MKMIAFTRMHVLILTLLDINIVISIYHEMVGVLSLDKMFRELSD